MTLSFPEDYIYAVDDMSSAVLFANSLGILRSHVTKLALIVLEPTPHHERIASLATKAALPSSVQEYFANSIRNRKEFGYNQAECFAFLLTPEAYRHISDLASSLATPEYSDYFADHVFGWNDTEPAISFHDAFCGDSMFCSPKISEELIQEFAKSVGGTCRLVLQPTGPM